MTTGFLLTVRGKYIPSNLEACRVLHNETAGSAPGIAAARSLGDLSHKVYAPLDAAATNQAGEVLFLDWWQDPKGIMEFFGNENVQKQGARLFRARDATVWMPAAGAFSYHLPAAAGRNERYVGMVRGPIASPEAAIKAFHAAGSNGQRTARARGLLTHEVFLKVSPPGDSAPPEVLGLDVWCDAKGMAEHYADPNELKGLSGAFAGKPNPTTWQQAAGGWSEW